jgi:peptide/nickel transport system substrate-binding protein
LSACQHFDASTPPRQPLSLTIGIPEGTAAAAGLGAGQQANMLALEGLTQVNADGRVVPRIAERWQWEQGGLLLRMFIRPRVQFHDGTPLTAALAAQVLERVISRPSNRALYPSVSDITQVHAEGELELVIRLSQPSAFLLEDLSVPLQFGDAGTGPYRVTKRQDSEITLEKFKPYYLGEPSIDRVVLRPFDALRTTWTSLLRGEVNMVTEVPPESLEFIKSADVQTFSFQHWYQFMLAFNMNDPRFASPALRRALNMAVDRSALIKNSLRGFGTPATSPLWPKYWAIDASVPAYRYDPSDAASLLDEAGYKKGKAEATTGIPNARLRLTCLIPRKFSVLERLALELQRQLYDVGVDVTFELLDPAQYDARIREGKFEAILVDMISGPTLGRPFIFWRSAKNYRGLNVFGYENAEAERLFQTLRTSSSEAAIRSATRRLQQVLLEDPPAVFLAWNERARVVRREFDVVQENGRDPISTLWRWTAKTTPIQTASLR